MIDKIALKILDLISDARLTHKDIEYLGWQLVWLAPRQMQNRLVLLADSIIQSHYKIQEQNDGQLDLF